jgi:hypothetical protein
MEGKEEAKKMRTSLLGEISPAAVEGFMLLRGLLVMFIVIICFAGALAAMAVVSRQDARLLENTIQEIDKRNAMAMRRVH